MKEKVGISFKINAIWVVFRALFKGNAFYILENPLSLKLFLKK